MKTLTPFWRRFAARAGDQRRRGVIIVLCAFLIQAMFAFCALAIDLGHIVLTTQQLQNAADAAALAAVLELKSAQAGDTVESLKQRALEQATLSGSLNRAALRPVVIGPQDVTFGDRNYNSETEQWETKYGADLAHVNSVRVDIAFDGDANPPSGYEGTWTPRVGRQELELFFGRVIDVPSTTVQASSAANLTPRDLVFCIDISGSMFGQSGGNTNRDGATMMKLFLDNIYGANVSVAGQYPQWYDVTYKGDYQRLWVETMTNGTFGTPAQTLQFVAQEFGDRNPAAPWTHWKWKAFCDWNYASLGGGFATTESARIYNGNGETKNINVSMTANAKNVSGGNIAGRLESRPANATVYPPHPAGSTKLGAMFGPEDYSAFCLWNGYIPCVKGQKYYPRDTNQDNVLDNPADVITQNPAAPYPTSIVYYPRVRDIEGFDETLLGSGSSFTGIYPNSVDARPMSIVRQATLFGLNSMIEAEAQGNAEIAFNQVGMVTFGTYAHPDLDLSNDLHTTLRTGASRLSTYPGNPYITPHASGATNIGMGLRYSVRMLTDEDGRGRSFAAKSICLLTDGEPNYSPAPSGNYEANEFNGNTQNLTGPDTNQGRLYAEYWADKCGDMDIQLHCIGLNLNASTQTFLEGLARSGGGVFEHISDPVAQRQELINIFVMIAKDKLGKLYSE